MPSDALVPDNPSNGARRPAGELDRHYLWNFVVLTGDASAWFFATAFLDVITVLPLFFQRISGLLTSHYGPLPLFLRASFLTGLALAIRSAGWLAPQFFSARHVAASSRKKPALLKACWTGRLPFAAAAIYLLAGPARSHPLVALLIVIVAWTFFSFGEGLASVPWTDIVARTIPARRRGRLFGGMQIIGGLLACGSGELVRRLLGPRAPVFPTNFGILVAVTFAMLMVSMAFLLLIREPADVEKKAEAPPIRDYLRAMPGLIKQERAFQGMLIVQFLGSIGGMAAPLYTLFATGRLHVPPPVIGRYLSIGMFGAVLGSAAWAFLNDTFGPRAVIRVNLIASLAAPWTALATALLVRNGYLSPFAATWCYSASFFFIGAILNGGFTGYTNYLLENTPGARRAEYVGLMNTLNAPAIIMPIIGTSLAGLLSPEAVFLISGAGCVGALLASMRLPAKPHSDGHPG